VLLQFLGKEPVNQPCELRPPGVRAQAMGNIIQRLASPRQKIIRKALQLDLFIHRIRL
jgi:hypothetical protein